MRPGNLMPAAEAVPTFPQGKMREYDDELPIPSIILADFPVAAVKDARQTHLQNREPAR